MVENTTSNLSPDSCKFSIELANIHNQLEHLLDESRKPAVTDTHDTFVRRGDLAEIKAIKCFIADLLSINWQDYAVDVQESFVDELGESISEGGMLRICIFHQDKTITGYTHHKQPERMFFEIVLAGDAQICVPSAHYHFDYFDYASKSYLVENEAIGLIRSMLKQNLNIQYRFRGSVLLSTSIWTSKSEVYKMGNITPVLNPLFWIQKLFSYGQPIKEENITVTWRK